MSANCSSAEVDFLDLCENNVRNIKVLANGKNLLNQRQCLDLSSKLSESTQNVRKLVLYCGASIVRFRPALENLYRHVEKAKVLVSSCAEEDWLAVAVFQIQNKSDFLEILLDVSLCYNTIYELVKSTSKDWNDPPDDLRQPSMSVFAPASDSDIDKDKQDLQKRLDDLANGYIRFKFWDYWIPGRLARTRNLAKYLLVKMCYTPSEPQASSLDTYSAVLWRKVSEPLGTWGNSRFLGAGSGASGVVSTTWLDIPCAKKEFHGQEIESLFMREAGILAHLKHPCIVNFICCGNGLERGDRFIAMELMEKSLFNLIEEQKDVCFSLPVAVDMMVQMARGVCYLHGRGVAHRDLKPQNVVVNRLTSPHLEGHYCVKLVDFGMSKTKVEVAKLDTVSALNIGTTRYRAPEVFRQAHPDGKGKANWFKADVYSFAMTCAHLLSLKTPFGGMPNLRELYDKLMKDERPGLPVECPQELVALLNDCWRTKPGSRPSFIKICTRLEGFRHTFVRGYGGGSAGLEEVNVDLSAGFEFIKMKVEEQSSIRTPLTQSIDEEEEGEKLEPKLPVLSCARGHALEFLHQPPSKYNYGACYCDLCWKDIDEELYHCETCEFDAHLDCAEMMVEVKAFFHNHPLHLLIKNYYNENPNAICRLCGESVQSSEWAYRCDQCDFDMHALCTKYPEERMKNTWHEHRLTLIQCPPHKNLLCAWCNGEVTRNTWRYTCNERWCTFDVHPSCVAISSNPLCIFDNAHRLRLVRRQKGTFYCGSCGALGCSWYYCCDHCDVNIHLDCVNDMEEDEDSWIEAYEELMAQSMTQDDLTKMDLITLFLDKFLVRDTLEGSSSSTSWPSPVLEGSTMKVQPTIQRLTPSEKPGLDAIVDDVDLRRKIVAETAERKAKRMTAKAGRLELKAKYLGMLENLERIVVDLQSSESMLQGDVEVRASTFEKLKNRKYIVEEEMATLVQSRMRHGPRTCLFFLSKFEDRDVWELLTSLRVDMERVHLRFFCEEPGHQHFVLGSFCRVFYKALGEDRLQKLQPLLASGLEVVARAMSTLGGQLTQLDCVTLPNLDMWRWDLRAIDLEKHGKSSKGKENAEELKRAEDTAADWLLSLRKVKRGVNYYEEYGLLRVRYKVTEEGKSPGYTRGSVAWLCSEHLHSGLEAGILESYPLMYYNPELN